MERTTGEKVKWGVATKEDLTRQLTSVAAKMVFVEQSLSAGGAPNRLSLGNYMRLKNRYDDLRRLGYARKYLTNERPHEENV